MRPRHTRYFPDGLWQLIIENAISRVSLGVHWIFDAFDFTGGNGSDPNPSFGNENIGGVGLGLRIARDIFAHGNNGQGPQITPNNIVPPLITPPPGSPMPARPSQPAEVGRCIGPAIDQPQAQAATKPSKKGAKKDARKKKVTDADVTSDSYEKEEPAWPSGISEKDEAPPSTPGAWPSGISEK